MAIGEIILYPGLNPGEGDIGSSNVSAAQSAANAAASALAAAQDESDAAASAAAAAVSAAQAQAVTDAHAFDVFDDLVTADFSGYAIIPTWITTAGYYTAGDGGHGLYIYDPNVTESFATANPLWSARTVVGGYGYRLVPEAGVFKFKSFGALGNKDVAEAAVNFAAFNAYLVAGFYYREMKDTWFFQASAAGLDLGIGFYHFGSNTLEIKDASYRIKGLLPSSGGGAASASSMIWSADTIGMIVHAYNTTGRGTSGTTLTNKITTTSGSPSVRVAWTGNGVSAVGQNLFIRGTYTFNGITLNGMYPVTTFTLAADCTFTDTGDLVNLTAHPYVNGDTITFREVTTTTGITTNTLYYVISAAANTFQVSLTLGGAAINLVTNGTGRISGVFTITAANNATATGAGGSGVICSLNRPNEIALDSQTLVDGFTTVDTSTFVTVNFPTHGVSATGQWIDIDGPVTINGITLDGPYTVAVLTDRDHFTINSGTPATSSGTGGASTKVTLSTGDHSASATLLEYFKLEGGGDTGELPTTRELAQGVKSGLWVRTQIEFRHIHVRWFAGNGIHIVGSSLGGIGGDNEGGPNLCYGEYFASAYCGGNGLYIDGADSNASTFLFGNFKHNGRSGVFDSDFLGNLHTGHHSNTNGIRLVPESTPVTPNWNTSVVTYDAGFGDQSWALVPGGETVSRSTTPGADPTVWEWVGNFGAPSGNRPLWSASGPDPTGHPGADYFVAASFISDNANATNVFVNCYTETGTAGFYLEAQSLAIGGNSPNMRASRGFKLRSTPSGAEFDKPMIVNVGKKIGAAIAYSGVKLGGTTQDYLMEFFHPDAAQSTNISQTPEKNMHMAYLNSASTRYHCWTGINTTTTFGRSVTVPYANAVDKLFIGDGVATTIGGHRCFAIRVAAPTTGAWGQGDFVINKTTTPGAPIGWRCVTAGTPGTWETITAVPAGLTTASITAIGDAINTTGKYTGKLIVDTTSNKMYRAQGATAGSTWISTDGVTTLTPV